MKKNIIAIYTKTIKFIKEQFKEEIVLSNLIFNIVNKKILS